MEDDLMNDSEPGDVVYALAVSPDFASSGTCFAACESGLKRSDDGGVNWFSAFDSLNLEEPLPAVSLALSPAFPTEATLFTGMSGGVLRSMDGGKSWTAAQLQTPAPLVSSLAVSPGFSKDGIIFAGTIGAGVFRSVDRGAEWVPWNFGLYDLTVLCLAVSPDFMNDKTIFIGTESGIFRSTNEGRSWRSLDFPGTAAPVVSLALSPVYGQDGTLFAGSELAGLFCSTDRGRTWQHVDGLDITGTVNAVLLSPSKLRGSPGFPGITEILVMLEDRLLFSQDQGKTWKDWKKGLEFEEGLVSVVAPLGLGAGLPLLVGLADGRVLRV
jgi:hypothetical protein